MIAVILVGGLGTRLRSILPDLPKPMAPVEGRPFLEHLLDYWIGQGCTEFVLAAGYRAEAISAHFGAAYKGCPVRCVIEKEPLGTGGAILAALASCDAKRHPRILVMNGDTFFAAKLDALARFHAEAAADLTLALLPSGSENRYGRIETDAAGKILSFGSTGSWINAGLYLFDARWAQEQAARFPGPKSLEGDLIPGWLREGRRIAGWRTDAPFLDIGIPASYAQAGDFVRRIHDHA